jgi:hypothetical protein
VYRAVALLRFATTRTSTPRFCASSRATAIGFDVKEYAATRILFFADSMVLTTRSVAPPEGENATSMDGALAGTAAAENSRKADSAASAGPFGSRAHIGWFGYYLSMR